MEERDEASVKRSHPKLGMWSVALALLFGLGFWVFDFYRDSGGDRCCWCCIGAFTIFVFFTFGSGFWFTAVGGFKINNITK